MLAIEDIMKNDLFLLIGRHGETEGIGAALSGHLRAEPGVAKVTEIAQGSVIGNALNGAGTAGSAEAGAQGKPARESPAQRQASLFWKKVGTSHSSLMLAPLLVDCVEFFASRSSR